MKYLINYKTFNESIIGVNKTINGFHVSKTPISRIDNRFLVDSHLRDKPEGVWFTYEPNKWKEFYYGNVSDSYFMYEIVIDSTNIITLDTIDKINEFNLKYESDKNIYKHEKDSNESVYSMIWTSPNWFNVKKEYYGIEFPNYEELKKDIDFNDVKNHWLTFIDMNSGCIWNEKSVIDFKEI